MTRRILVIDGDERHRMSLVAMLQEEGFETVEFDVSAANDLNDLIFVRADLVLVDLLGAEVPPTELLRLLRTLLPSRPLVAIGRTGGAHRVLYADVMSYFGADACLERPVDRTALLHVIHRFCQFEDRSKNEDVDRRR